MAYRDHIMVALSVLAVVSFLAAVPHLVVAFCAALVLLMSWNRIVRTASKMSISRPARTRIAVRDLREDPLMSAFRPILDMPPLRRVQDRLERAIKPYILRSGSAANPRLLGMRSVLYAILAGIAAVPAGVLAIVVYGPAGASLFSAPLLVLAVHFAVLRMRESERRAAISDELAPFATLASILESVNIPLYSTFARIAGSCGMFPVMRREAERIRNITALGSSPTDALMDLADSHPSVTFRDFIVGYVSSFNTGGADTSRYLQDQAGRFFGYMRYRMTSYAKQADMVAQVILTVMLLLPMMGLSMTFFATGAVAGTMMLLLIAVFPMISVVLIVMIDVRQPRNYGTVRVSWMVFPAGIAGALLVYHTQNEIWQALGAGAVICCMLNAALARKGLSESGATESQLPEFMRQMTRFRNIGIDIMHGIKGIREEIIQRRSASKHRFNATFDRIIDRLYMGMAAGSTLEDAVAGTRISSWNARLVFFILGTVHESGGGTAKTLDDITRWVTQYADAKREMIQSLRSSLFTAFIGPVLMVMISVVSGQLADEFEDHDISGLADVTIRTAPASDVLWLSEILTVTAVICMGVVLSKINYFTVRHTLFTGIITLFTMALLYMVPYLPEFEL